jgi:O-antigen/teichoic acid export membrane protein
MSESTKLIKNTTIYALGDIVPRFLNFITFPILTRYLLPSDYGIINYVTTLTTFLTALGFLCVNTYYMVHYYRCENEEARKKLLGNLFSFVILFNIIIIALFLLFGNYIFNALASKVSFNPYIIIALLFNFFNLFAVLPSALYRLLEKPALLTIINISNGVITMIFTFILVIHFNYTALGILYANLAVSALFSVIFLYTIRNHITWNLNLSQIKTVLAFSLPLLPGSLAYYITTLSDRILISKYLSLNDLGIYSTAATVASILTIVSFGAYKAFEPHIFKKWGDEAFLKIFEGIRNGFIYVLLIGVLCLTVFSKEFFQIMTNVKFHVAYWYVPIIIIGIYCSSLSMLYGTIITAKGKTKINSLINITGACISIVLNVLLLQKYGLVIAAMVSSLAMTVMMSISIWYADLKIDRIKPFCCILISAISIYILVYCVDIHQIVISILVKVLALSVVLYILSLILSINPFKIIGHLSRRETKYGN